MAETAQTMTEFTYAPGEKNIVGDRFSPSVIIFWLKTSIAASSTRVQYKAPNTLFGLIPLGAFTKTTAQTNSVLIQQQMLANQQAQAEQQTQASAQSEQTQQGE